MSAERAELMPENEAVNYLNITAERLRLLVVQGELQMALVCTASGEESMYFTSQIIKLKDKLKAEDMESEMSEIEEWPEVIHE